MRRWLFATMLLAGIVSISRADYFLVRVVLKQSATTPGKKVDDGGKDPMAVAPIGLQSNDAVSAVVDVTSTKQLMVPNLGQVLFFEHKFGRTAYYPDTPEIQTQHIKMQVVKSPVEQYAERRAVLQKATDRGRERYLELAAWCLEVGLPDKCQSVLNEIEKMPVAKDAKETRVPGVLQAYKDIKPLLADEIVAQEKALAWKKKLGYGSAAPSKHYALVHNSSDPERDGVKSRLEALENNFRTFYLLFAIKGKSLPAPTEKLTAILVADANAFRKLRQTFDVTELVSDGFFARQDNLAVFAPNRLDNASRNFEQDIRDIEQKFNSVKLLKGEFPPFAKEKELTQDELAAKAMDAARAQVIALVEAALRDESEIATATHEGTRQLFAETGLLPRNAAAPEWLRFGLASLFEMPKGPFPGKNASSVKLAFWPGAGGANWAWRRYLDEMDKDELISEQPVELLYKTLSGYWTEHAHELSTKPKDEGMTFDPVEAAQTEIARGRCLSWALAYFLFTDKFPELMAFLGDLANQPRDVELDEFAFLNSFCKAFKIDTKGLTRERLDGNLNAYADFAKEWMIAVRRAPAPAVQLKLEDPNNVKPVDPDDVPKKK